MQHLKLHKLFLPVAIFFMLLFLVIGCEKSPLLWVVEKAELSETTNKIVHLNPTPDSVKFVNQYKAKTTRRDDQASDIPLQISTRVAPINEAANVCETGRLYGPITISKNSSEFSSQQNVDQETLYELSSQGLAVCLVVTSPVDVTLNIEADKAPISTSTCETEPADFSGTWLGSYSCTSTCVDSDNSGYSELNITQDKHTASFIDYVSGDYDTSYAGTVCGDTFEYSTQTSTFSETGSIKLESEGVAKKTYQYTKLADSCNYTCNTSLEKQTAPSESQYDFTYAITDPWAIDSDSAAGRIVTRNNINAVGDDNNNVHYWCPYKVGAQADGENPAVMTMWFSFPKKVKSAHLIAPIQTFNLGDSNGHGYLYASKDGVNWLQLNEVEPPAEVEGSNANDYNDLLPESLLGAQALRIKVELSVFGENVNYSNICAAQFARYNMGSNDTTFKLEVEYE